MHAVARIACVSTLGAGLLFAGPNARAQASPEPARTDARAQRSPEPARTGAEKDGGGNGAAKGVGIAAIIIGTGAVVAGSIALLVGAAKDKSEGDSQPLSLGLAGGNGRGTTATAAGATQDDSSGFGKYDVAAIAMGGGAVLVGLGVALVTLGSANGPERQTQSSAAKRTVAVTPVLGPGSGGLRVRF